jgi:hypothetical protein
MLDVLGLALYGPLAASTRYRLLQYIPNTQEIQLQVNSLLNDVYLTRRFNGQGVPWANMLQSIWRLAIPALNLMAVRRSLNTRISTGYPLPGGEGTERIRREQRTVVGFEVETLAN